VGLNDGRYRDGTYHFRCGAGHGIYLREDAFRPVLHHDSRHGAVDMLGRHGVEAEDPAETGSHVATRETPAAPWGSSYTAAYQPGDWENAHATSTQETGSWSSKLDAVEAKLLARKQEVVELTAALQNTKISCEWEELHKIEGQLKAAKVGLARVKKERHQIAHQCDAPQPLEGDHRDQNRNLQMEADLKRIEREYEHSNQTYKKPAFETVKTKPLEGHEAYHTDLSITSNHPNYAHGHQCYEQS